MLVTIKKLHTNDDDDVLNVHVLDSPLKLPYTFLSFTIVYRTAFVLSLSYLIISRERIVRRDTYITISGPNKRVQTCAVH